MSSSDDILSFIEQAQLADTPGISGLDAATVQVPELADSVEQGAVVDSNIVTYPEGTPLAVKAAVGNWVLFAQRVASDQVEGTKTEEWCNAYLDVLTNTGWAMREQASAWTQENAYGSKVHEEILKVVSLVLGPVPMALAIVTGALASLNAMDDDSPWIRLFDRRGKSADAVGFSIANCEAGSQGGAALREIDFRIHAEQTMTQVLFFTFTSREARMYKRAMMLELSASSLEKFGPAIEARVSEIIGDAIAAFPLKKPDPTPAG